MTDDKNKKPAGADPAAVADPAGGDPAAAGKKAGAANPAAGDPAGDGDAPAGPYRPEGLPDHLLGESDKETIDKLKKSVDGFREAQSAKGVPAKPEDYKLELPPEIQDKVVKPGADGKDPVLEQFKGIFHKHNIPQAAFNSIVGEVYQKVTEIAAAKGADPSAATAEAMDFEFKSMGGVEKAKPLIDGVQAWLGGLKGQGRLDDADLAELQVTASYPAGLKSIAKLRELAGEKPIPISFTATEGQKQLTEADLNARVADNRYNKKHKDFDPDFHKDTTRLFDEFYNKPSAAA